MAKIPGVNVREVAVRYDILTSTSYTADVTPLKFTVKVVDTHNAYNPVTGEFIAPHKGTYLIDLRVNQVGDVATYTWVNGVRQTLLNSINNTFTYKKSNGMVYLQKGDILTLRLDSTATPVSGDALQITNQALI